MNEKIHALRFSATNSYLIECENGKLLFDTGWAGTFPALCASFGKLKIPVQSISCILISHFHPDHMGAAQELADAGPVILVPDVQLPYIHASDAVFAKEGNRDFVPVDDEKIRTFPIDEGRKVLKEYGIDGRILHTPGHSDDSISLWLDEGSLFVGDLNPLYELEAHRGTQIADTWDRLLELGPKTVYYGHAAKTVIEPVTDASEKNGQSDGNDASEGCCASEGNGKPEHNEELCRLVTQVMRCTDKGFDIKKICRKTGAEPEFIEDVMRMYLTHRGIGVQGILDRIEIKNR
ncbi:MAG: MBL fold metallo-hydrolase [Lachnospiraceae bacterium]|nr:MBL fold metallo-hydrolase [Lachnospiraceae bacterium]